MQRTRLAKPLVGLALLAVVIGVLPTAYAWVRRPSLEGLRVGMTKSEFEALKLPLRLGIGSGSMGRYSEGYQLDNGERLATRWDYIQKPPRLLWFKLNP
jgi:hypothetical protein